MILRNQYGFRQFFPTSRYLVAIFSLVLALPTANATCSDSLLDDFGGMAGQSDSPWLSRANVVFAAINTVADKSARYTPRLKIVRRTTKPWVLAYQCGDIILSKAALDTIYQDVDQTVGDARLAFVIGHEFAHLAHSTFTHQRAYKLFSGQSDDGQQLDLRQQIIADDQERQADQFGLLYAALAGYPVHTLFAEPRQGRADFLQHWAQQTRAYRDDTEAVFAERAALLRERLTYLRDRLPAFFIGLQYTQLELFEDAITFWEPLTNDFPSREILNNLAYAYLQLARSTMNDDVAYQFCMPGLVDSETRLEEMTHRGSVSDTRHNLSDEQRELLTRALDKLMSASAVDPSYTPALINQSIVALYLGDFQQAQSAIRTAQQQRTLRRHVNTISAVVDYLSGLDHGQWRSVLERLQIQADTDTSDSCAAFNLAQMLDHQQQPQQAMERWQQAATQLNSLPLFYQAIVCEKVPTTAACQRLTATKDVSSSAPPWTPPVSFDIDLENAADKAEFLNTWRPLPSDELPGQLYQRKDGSLALAREGFIEMIRLHLANPEPIEVLQVCCQTPSAITTTVNGELWDYDKEWAVLVKSAQVHEVWYFQ